jgi:polysaccharide biosynthesis/export protein
MIRGLVILRLSAALALMAGSHGEALGEEKGHPAATRVEAGDVIQVTVSGPSAGIEPINSVTLPSQAINCAGVLAVPHAGDIAAAGRTLAEVAREIEQRLATRALDPRIVVTLVARNAGCPL